jgi:O-antigen chain-terminating methyltransferase
LRSEFNNAAEHLRHLQVQADRITAVAADLQCELGTRAEHDKQLGEQLRAETAQRGAVRHDLESLEQRQTSDSAFIKAELSRQSELVHKLTHRAPARIPAKSKQAADGDLSETAAHRLDAFYFSFENRFRGPREEIKRRLRFYLPVVENCRAGKRGRPIVDLGCGRGEWLELLREQKLTAAGVDLNETMIDQCKQRALNVVQADALEFLRRLPDNSHGAITGFHIIEHLPLDTLVSLVAETFRVLRPGGLGIFESPNCKNLTVGACTFYIDPTHRNPVFPETAQFILESNGFERVTLEYLCPVETTDISDLGEQSAHLRELLYGPRDFGVIGYKPIGT